MTVKKSYSSDGWAMLETALELIKICRAAGHGTWVPRTVFVSYSSATKGEVYQILHRMTEAGLMESRDLKFGPAAKRVKGAITLWDLCVLFKKQMLPPRNGSCNTQVNKMLNELRDWMQKDIRNG